jgi:LPS sulfotransferase NodH
MRREQSVQFLEKYIWRLQNKNIKAVGFKLFYYHAKDMDWNRIWAYLQEDSSIKIIHLHRNNCLKTVLSHQTAIKHKRWHSNVEKQEPLYLDFNYCKKYFEDFHQYEKSISTKFINHNIYKFYYEDLISEKENIMSEIFKFLDVQEMDSSSSMKKLNKKPLDQSIKNYYELKQKFMDTPWQKYFTI